MHNTLPEVKTPQARNSVSATDERRSAAPISLLSEPNLDLVTIDKLSFKLGQYLEKPSVRAVSPVVG